jgi:hypothetical protein
MMNSSDDHITVGGVSATGYSYELTAPTGPFIRLNHRPEQPWLHADWIGFIDSERGQKACLAIVDALMHTGVSLLLNDNRNQSGPWPKLDEWLATVWVPALSGAGLKRMAHIHSASIFTQVSAKRFAQDVIQGIEFAHFDDENQAIEWLQA